MNRQLFFEAINQSLFGGRLSARQKAGMEVKLDAFEAYEVPDPRWTAYMLATAYHETAHAMEPVEERGKGCGRSYGRKQKRDGTAYVYPDRLYYGRGDVQLTWYENYQQMGEILGIPLLEQPELALQPAISARIMIEGMTRGCSGRGDFTGVSLEDYFNGYREDPVNARRVVNGLDSAQRIAGYYRKFLLALRAALMLLLLLVAGCKSAQLTVEKVATRTDSTATGRITDEAWRSETGVAILEKEETHRKGEDIRFSGEARIREIHYDTAAALDTATGRYPVAWEIITAIGRRYGKQAEEESSDHVGARFEGDLLSFGSKEQYLSVDVERQADRALEKKPETPWWRRKFFWIAVVAGMVCTVVLVKFVLKK